MHLMAILTELELGVSGEKTIGCDMVLEELWWIVRQLSANFDVKSSGK